MHFIYEEAAYSTTELMQGDVLQRTPGLNEVLRTVHPHFFQHPKNLFFMVLTQSCDLVRRGPGQACKAPYITIAPVRTLDLVVERQVTQLEAANVKAELPVVGNKAKNKLSEFLSRLLNNNEPGFFYLDAEGTVLGRDCVALLNLSIAIKSDFHLEKCVSAKILQLTDTFQAKLGWLVGQLYSRVGTQDMDASRASQKIREAVREAAIWIDDGKIDALEKQADPEKAMTAQEISLAIKKVPNAKQQVISRAAEIMASTLGAGQEDTVRRLTRNLTNDAALSKLLQK
jgi:hypothetical protein